MDSNTQDHEAWDPRLRTLLEMANKGELDKGEIVTRLRNILSDSPIGVGAPDGDDTSPHTSRSHSVRRRIARSRAKYL